MKLVKETKVEVVVNNVIVDGFECINDYEATKMAMHHYLTHVRNNNMPVEVKYYMYNRSVWSIVVLHQVTLIIFVDERSSRYEFLL